MRKKLNIKKLFLSLPVLLIVLIGLTSADELNFNNYDLDKTPPATLTPMPGKAYIYGNFQAYHGDSYTFENGEQRYFWVYQKNYGQKYDSYVKNYTHFEDLLLIGIDTKTKTNIFFRQKRRSENDSVFVFEVDPGLYRFRMPGIPAFSPAILSQEFYVEPGKIYYLGDYMRNFAGDPLTPEEQFNEDLISPVSDISKRKRSIQFGNRFSVTTHILRKKYPGLANLPSINAFFDGEPESPALVLNPNINSTIKKLKTDINSSKSNPSFDRQFEE